MPDKALENRILGEEGAFVKMDMDKKQRIKDKNVLNNIVEGISSIAGISILDAYNSHNVSKNYVEALNKIYAIDFPILTTKERGLKNIDYVESLYNYLKLSMDSFHWIIPHCEGSNWWVELEIGYLDNFINYYYPGNKAIDFTAIDTKYQLLFDIEMGEEDIEYRIIWLKNEDIYT